MNSFLNFLARNFHILSMASIHAYYIKNLSYLKNFIYLTYIIIFMQNQAFGGSKQWKDLFKAVLFASQLDYKPVYSIKNDAIPLAGTAPTAYKILHNLESLGLAKITRSMFQINTSVVYQPLHVIKKLQPSLVALQQARRFGKYYTQYDINFVNKHLSGKFLKTLDYAAWELTRYQTPQDLFIYVKDVETATKFLVDSGFSEGKNGRIILLPKTGSFANMIERVYLDCIASGGRSTLDAVAIELLYKNKLTVQGRFTVEQITKVLEDLRPYQNREIHGPIST